MFRCFAANAKAVSHPLEILRQRILKRKMFLVECCKTVATGCDG